MREREREEVNDRGKEIKSKTETDTDKDSGKKEWVERERERNTEGDEIFKLGRAGERESERPRDRELQTGIGHPFSSFSITL